MKRDRPSRIRLGMITPSSNSVLEPICTEMLRNLPGVSAHFARVRVTHISLESSSTAQFDPASIQDAAEMLADARVDSICWNATSASWLGLDQDAALCAAIEQRTGIAATSATLATVELLRRARARQFGLVSPYTSDVQDRIIAKYAALGFECAAERHGAIVDNFAVAGISQDILVEMIREVAAAGPQAISVLCTNLDGASLAARLEDELGIRILHSTACALWASLTSAGVSPGVVEGWGSLFAL